jgi:hypothetical protein
MVMKQAKMVPDSKPIMVGETGIQAAIRLKKTKDMMEDAEEAIVEARALAMAMRGRRG